MLGHAEEQGPNTGRRVRLGTAVGKGFAANKRGMGARGGGWGLRGQSNGCLWGGVFGGGCGWVVGVGRRGFRGGCG